MTDYTGLDGGPADERLRAVGVGLLVALVGIAAGVVSLIALASLLGAVGVPVRGPGASVVVQYGLSVVALQGIGFLVVASAFIYTRGRRDLLRVRVPTLRELGVTVAGIVGLLVLLSAIQAGYTAFGIETPNTPIVEDGLRNPTLMLYMIPLTYLLVGPGEELMFRGIVQGLLREAYAPAPAIVIASVVFALIHFTNVLAAPPAQQVAYLAAIFALSLLLGAIYEYTDNLVVTALIHGSYNALLFLALYARATGLA